MTKSQELQLKSSELREKINALGALETRSDEQRGELDKLTRELTDVETRFRAEIAIEGTTQDDFDEDEQLRELSRRANAGEILDAALEHRSTDGATREIQEEFNLQGNQIPLAMLRYGTEHRAVTPAPSNVQANQNEIIPGVFPMSCAAWLGIDMPTVPVGDATFPVLTTNATAHAPAEGADANETTGSFSADSLSPGRLQASFFYSREDRARFAGMDAALRMNLSDALSDGLDKQIISGSSGLLSGSNLSDNDVSAVTSYALYVSDYAYSRVDGVFANDVKDLKILFGAATYAHASTLYRGNAADQHALARLQADTSGVKVSSHVPAVASNQQNGLVRLGERRDAVAGLWDGISLIPDEISKAKSGEVILTAVMLYAFKILRTGGFYKKQSQHA